MENIKIFTDGASRGNPGPGGWGAVISIGDEIIEIGGKEDNTTNNRMEVKAIVESIKKVRSEDKKISLYSDSKYAIQGITEWIHGWKNNGWKTKNKTEVLNRDLWEEADEAIKGLDIVWHRLEGHVGIAGNEKADEIATAFATDKGIDLYEGSYVSYGVDLSKIEKNIVNKEKKDRSRVKAYSYLSLVGGVLEIHDKWSDCEARVKGKSNVKFRKSISKEDEVEIKKEWGVL